MRLLRLIAVLLGASLIIGEAYRSWGAGRPVAFWLEDMIMGGLLIVAAAMTARPTPRTRALFSGASGFAACMLYGSFFGKVFAPASENPGNFDLDTLTLLVGAAFVVAVAGFVASLAIEWKPS